MRYTRVGTMSYVVTLLLFGVALAFAAWRARPAPAPRGDGIDPPWLIEGRVAYRAECADCHPAPGEIAPVAGSGPATAGVIDLLIRGEARIARNGRERLVTGHPPFDHLPDARIAAIVGFLGSGQGESRPAAGGPPPVAPGAIEARRRLPR